MVLSEVFITLHTYYPHPLYSSPISIFYFTFLRFYSIFASPFYYCYNILDGFYPPFFFRSDYVSFFYCTLSDIFLPISVSPPFNLPLLCLSIAYAYKLSFLVLQSHHFILPLLFFLKYFFLTTIPDEGLSPKRRIIKIFSLNLYISHLDH